MTGAALGVSLIGQALAQARGLASKSAIKQVDRVLSNAGVVPWDLFGSWVGEVVGGRREFVVAMDWTDFDADNQSTLVLHLVTRHGRTTSLLWLTVDKDELKDQRNDFEDLCLSRRHPAWPAESTARRPSTPRPSDRSDSANDCDHNAAILCRPHLLLPQIRQSPLESQTTHRIQHLIRLTLSVSFMGLGENRGGSSSLAPGSNLRTGEKRSWNIVPDESIAGDR